MWNAFHLLLANDIFEYLDEQSKTEDIENMQTLH